MRADLVEAEPTARSVLSSPRRFVRGCASVALAVAVLGAVGLVDRAFAFPLAGLVLVTGGLAALIPVEERQHALRAGGPDRDLGPATESEPPPGPGPIVPDPDPGPVVPDPDPNPVVPEPEPAPIVPEPDPSPGPVVPDPDPSPVVPEPEPAPLVPEPEPGRGAVLPEAEPAAPATVQRTFRLPATVGAEEVWVVGEFNGWSRTADPMVREGDAFVARIALPPGRAYRYRYLLDGVRWENDWQADRYEPNAFGEDDSIVLT